MFKELIERNVAIWPAWGEMDVSAHQELAQQPGPPPDWDQPAKWQDFIQEMAGLIGQTLWTGFDFEHTEFPPATLTQRRELTAADLTLLMEMQKEVPEHFQQPIRTPVSGPAPSTHFAYFQLEENSVFGSIYREYDATLPQELLAQAGPVMDDGFGRKTGTAAKQFKRLLQRPRPYQMATAYGITGFRHQPAATAQTPSMVSGHCLAGLIMVGALIDKWLTAGVPVSEGSWQALEQYAVDIGDRRVMAGVHYPGDNISSWLVGLSMCPHVFANSTAVKKHLWDAITLRSFVYGRIAGFKAGVYRDALQALDRLKP